MQIAEPFPKSEEDIQKEYNQKIFLKTLKEGKTPTRKCLIKYILYLSGVYREVVRIDKNYNIPNVADLNKYDRSYHLSIISIKNANQMLSNEFLIKNLKRYLDDSFVIRNESWNPIRNIIAIYFVSNKVRWDLIDHDLKANHADNILIKPNGFVYVKNYFKKFQP